MQSLDFEHFSYEDRLALRKIAQRAIRKNRITQKLQKIIAKFDNELGETRTIKFSFASKQLPTINFKDLLHAYYSHSMPNGVAKQVGLSERNFRVLRLSESFNGRIRNCNDLV